MSDHLREELQPGIQPATPGPRDGKIEELLLTGLDRYFAGQYDQAINVWTRVLFLDRGHARARAYIERARGALAEQQRESEELFHTGIAALERGDVATAGDLLRSAVEHGGARDDALAVLDRVSRLQTVGAVPSRPATCLPTRDSRTPRDADRVAEPARARSFLPWFVLIAVGAAGYYAFTTWGTLPQSFSVVPAPAEATTTPTPPPADLPLPRPTVGEIAIDRARALFERGHLHEALRLLEEVRPGDPRRGSADELRAAIQWTLLSGMRPRSDAATGER